MSKAIHVNLDVGREGVDWLWSAEKAFRSNPCLSQQKLLSRPVYCHVRGEQAGAVVLLAEGKR